MSFPPAKGTKIPKVKMVHESVSNGGGGITASLKVKAAGSKNAPGVEKTVSAS